MTRLLALLPALLLTANLLGCAAKSPLPAGLDPAGPWQAFRATQQRLADAPRDVSLSATLMFSRQERTNRTTLRLWGRLGTVTGAADAALRLDVQAGVGTPLAYVAEDVSGLVVLSPTEKTAHLQPDRQRSLAALGLDLPFSLADLAAACAGLLALVPPDFRTVEAAPDGLVYSFGDSAIASLTLDASGRPVALSGTGPTPWVLRFPPGDDAAWPPRLLEVELSDAAATLRVRELVYRQEPWTDAALRLDLPAGTQLRMAEPLPALTEGGQ